MLDYLDSLPRIQHRSSTSGYRAAILDDANLAAAFVVDYSDFC
jgi:hypothetical protein